MSLARAVLGAAEVPAVDLWNNLYRIHRFDRPKAADSGIFRLHQEDFCQALGLGPRHKYEPTQPSPEPSWLSRCMVLLNELGDAGLVESPAVERQRLLDRVLFNVLVHNADAHLKNYALLYGKDSISVAPIYDALCTDGIAVTDQPEPWGREPAAPTPLDRIMGLRIGATFDIRRVSDVDLAVLARECGLTPRYARSRLEKLAEAVLDRIPVVADAVRNDWPQTERAIEHALPLIREQVRRVGAL